VRGDYHLKKKEIATRRYGKRGVKRSSNTGRLNQATSCLLTLNLAKVSSWDSQVVHRRRKNERALRNK